MKSFKNIQRKRLAFSLIELMISLIVVSAITAAFTPILSKKIKSNTISIGNKQCTVNDCPKDKGVIKSDECKLCDACDKDELVCLMCNKAKESGCAVNIRECYCEKCNRVNDDEFKNAEILEPDNNSQSNCVECDWQPGNGLSCTGCKVGYYLKEDKNAKFLGNDVTIKRCKTCEKGNYCPDGKKPTICPEGHYCPNEGMTDPTECPPGHYCPDKGMTEPTKCSAGTYSAAGASSCTNCSAGTYSGAGASSCTNCPAGTYQDETGKTSCKNCPAGTASNVEGAKSSSACKNCPAKTYSTAGSSTCKNCNSSVLTCNPTNGNCASCPSGYKCEGKICKLACKDIGSTCSSDSDCCSGYCGISFEYYYSGSSGGGSSSGGSCWQDSGCPRSNRPGALTGAGLRLVGTCQYKPSGGGGGGGGGGGSCWQDSGCPSS